LVLEKREADRNRFNVFPRDQPRPAVPSPGIRVSRAILRAISFAIGVETRPCHAGAQSGSTDKAKCRHTCWGQGSEASPALQIGVPIDKGKLVLRPSATWTDSQVVYHQKGVRPWPDVVLNVIKARALREVP